MSRLKNRMPGVRIGNVTIPIYKSTTAKGYTEFKVVFYDSDRKRRFKTFADYDEARKYAGKVNASINTGAINAVTLNNDERLIYLRAKEILRETTVTLDFAAGEYAYAVKTLGAGKFRAAVDHYAAIHKGVETRSAKTVVDEFLREKEKPGQPNKRPASERYLTDLKSRLHRFAKCFACDINTIGSDHLKLFLDSLKVGGRTYVNYVRAIATLFNYAKAKKYVPRDFNPLENIDSDFDDVGKIEIFTPRNFSKLLRSAEPDLIPFLVIGAFAGLRHAELLRLDWAEVKPQFIEVTKAKAKTRSRRLVPIQPNLQKWLASYRKESGPVVPFKSMFRPIQKLRETSGVKWEHNGLRHSFCSYRYADCKNENVVAMEAGNTPQKLFANYRELVTEASAKAWFSIEPQASENILTIAATGQCA